MTQSLATSEASYMHSRQSTNQNGFNFRPIFLVHFRANQAIFFSLQLGFLALRRMQDNLSDSFFARLANV